MKYLQLSAKLNCLNISNFYEILEVSILGHFTLFVIKNLWNLLYFIFQDASVSREAIRQILDNALQQCIAAS